MTTTGISADTEVPADLAQLRVLLVHEWLYAWAGAERDLEQLVALLPHADVLVGVVTPEMRRHHAIAERAIESWVGAIPGARARHRWFLPLHAAAFRGFDTSKYDLIVSISHAFEKAVRAREGATHVCYCLSPPRWLWDLGESHKSLATPAQRLALRLGTAPFRALDKAMARGVDRFVSQSKFIADRVRRVYGRDSSVVYPPVAAKAGATRAARRERFLFTLGRLVPYKRVDLAILAAERLGVRLVVAGDGPERDRLVRMAGRNVEFLGEIPEADAATLLSTCAAFVFCAEEDFGIAPLEANAHGAPVVALARGGVTETLVPGESAVFFDEPSVDALCTAIRTCLDASWDEAAIRRNAERFSPDRFRAGMRDELRRALARR